MIDLEEKIIEVLKESPHWIDDFNNSTLPPFYLLFDGSIEHRCAKDLSKVVFGKEHMVFADDGGFLGLRHHKRKKIPYFVFQVFGRGQCPVTMALYWNGKTLRGNIPNVGNNFNPRTKKAYWINKEEDLKYLRDMGYNFMDDWDFAALDTYILDPKFVDMQAIIKAIEKEI